MAKSKVVKSFTLKGEDLEMAAHAIEGYAELCEVMLDDKELSAAERGAAGFDVDHCRKLVAQMKGGK